MKIFYYAGNIPPSQFLAENGEVWGWMTLKRAETWKERHNKAGIWEFSSDNYKVDTRTYFNRPSGSSVVAHSVLDERPMLEVVLV